MSAVRKIIRNLRKDHDRKKVMEWCFSSDTGISSERLAAEFLGVEYKRRWGSTTPSDPSDLGRCLRLIELVPSVRSAVDSLALKSERWAKAAAIWDDITQMMKDEVGINWENGKSAPKTYELMKNGGL